MCQKSCEYLTGCCFQSPLPPPTHSPCKFFFLDSHFQHKFSSHNLSLQGEDSFSQGTSFCVQCHKLDMFIEEQSSQLTQHDFEQSYRMWSGFEIVAQLQRLDLGPQDCDRLTVNSLLKGILMPELRPETVC